MVAWCVGVECTTVNQASTLLWLKTIRIAFIIVENITILLPYYHSQCVQHKYLVLHSTIHIFETLYSGGPSIVTRGEC